LYALRVDLAARGRIMSSESQLWHSMPRSHLILGKRSFGLTLATAAFLAGCATTPSAPHRPSALAAESAPPPYFLRLDSYDPFAAVDQAILRVGMGPETSAQVTSAPSSREIDLWSRVIQGFRFANCPAGSRAEQWAEWFGDRHEYLQRVMNRAQPWLYDIATELERRKLPGELALLPIVESAFDPFAYSHGRAAGPWQFIASTAREYGLEINEFYDGRRDFYAATRAALDYLETLNRRFDEDWEITLAAYNGGQGRVGRAIQANRAGNRSTAFADLRLPRETRSYVPKMHGLGCLFADPERFGWQRPVWANEPRIARIELPGAVDVVELSALANLDLTELVALNAGLNRHLSSPTGPFHLIVPLDRAEQVRRSLSEVTTENLVEWREIRVQRGDTLSHLAVRHATTISALRQANGLTSDDLQIGQVLRLPTGGRLSQRSAHLGKYQELAELQQRLLPTKQFRHRVRPGESLWVIARRYGVGVSDLQRWNGLGRSSLIRPGQALSVRMDQRAPARPVASYTVRQGDSLWRIARRLNVSLVDLMRWNGLNEASILRPGQTLSIRGGADA